MSVTALSKVQLALALAVVKQKPPDKDVKDYILEVRSFIKSSKDLGHVGSIDKFFDSVSFWQQAYAQSEAGQSKLHDEVHELQQRVEGLVSKLRVKTTNDNESSQKNKRKAPTAGKGASSSNVVKKRAKLPSSMHKSIPLMDEDNDSEDEDALCLSRQLYTLQKVLQRRPNTNSTIGSLAVAAVTLCKAAEQKLIHTVQDGSIAAEQKSSQIEAEQPNAPNSETVFNGVTVAFHLVHKTLQKLTATENGKQHQGQVTYYLVGLFESTMTALTLHCTFISKKPNPNTKGSAPSTGNEIASSLAEMLCTMAISLDLSRTEDQEVMEGFLFLVLNRMGRMMSLHVFHDIRLPMGLCPGMTFPEGLEAMADEGLLPNEAQLETRYLIRLLSRMLDVESHPPSPEVSTTRQFIENAKERLQKTLLRAVFGPDDHLFREVLRRPQTPPPLYSPPVEQEKFADWLTHELWRLVGWDVLRTVFGPN